jgi:hypothetical protein
MKPKGALTWPQAVKLAKQRKPLYKVYLDGNNPNGPNKVIPTGKINPRSDHLAGDQIVAAGDQIVADGGWIYQHEWFGGKQEWGWVFSNYFHALAYSLKVKAK